MLGVCVLHVRVGTILPSGPGLGLPVLLVLLAIPLVVAAGTLTVPNTFTNGDVADAAGAGRTTWPSQGQLGGRGKMADPEPIRLQGAELQRERKSVQSGIGNTGWWAVESDVGRVAHGIPKRVDRLKAIGNAIVPQVAYEILKRI